MNIKSCKSDPCCNFFIPSNGNQKHCSQRCTNRKKTKTYVKTHGHYAYSAKTCPQCNKEFRPSHSKGKFCSRGCAAEDKRKYLDIPDCLESADRKLDKNIGYVRVYVPMHPEANSRGYVYEHRIIAEGIIGRRLVKGEIVHHKNGKRHDNRPINLEVMTQQEHGKLRGQREKDLSI